MKQRSLKARSRPVEVHEPQAPASSDELTVGRVAHVDEGRIFVHLPGPLDGAIAVEAESVVDVAPGDAGRSVVLQFLRGPSRTPVILGFLATSDRAASGRRASMVRIDGESLILTADRTIELRCGSSTIVLGRDGHVEVRGTEVTSRASKLQKIRGAMVRIN